MKSLILGRNVHQSTETTFIRDLKFALINLKYQIIKYL